MKFNRLTSTRYNHPHKSQDENDLLYEIRMSDTSDGWGTCMAWLFAMCDYLYEHGDYEADVFLNEVRYQCGACGPSCEGYEYEAICELAESLETVLRVARILSRWSDMLRAAGKDY